MKKYEVFQWSLSRQNRETFSKLRGNPYFISIIHVWFVQSWTVCFVPLCYTLTVKVKSLPPLTIISSWTRDHFCYTFPSFFRGWMQINLKITLNIRACAIGKHRRSSVTRMSGRKLSIANMSHAIFILFSIFEPRRWKKKIIFWRWLCTQRSFDTRKHTCNSEACRGNGGWTWKLFTNPDVWLHCCVLLSWENGIN